MRWVRPEGVTEVVYGEARMLIRPGDLVVFDGVGDAGACCGYYVANLPGKPEQWLLDEPTMGRINILPERVQWFGPERSRQWEVVVCLVCDRVLATKDKSYKSWMACEAGEPGQTIGVCEEDCFTSHLQGCATCKELHR
jgi:hypothetical protein